jgi:hypothetical protein
MPVERNSITLDRTCAIKMTGKNIQSMTILVTSNHAGAKTLTG